MVLKRIAFACVGIALLAGCEKKKTEKSVATVEPVAKVNGEVIGKEAFEAQVARNLARYRGQSATLPAGIEPRIRESILRRMIDSEVVRQKAAAEGIQVTDAEVSAKFEEHKKRFRTDKAFQDYLERSHNTVESMKEDIRANLLRDRVVDKLSEPAAVTPEEIAEYYEKNKARFVEKEQIRASRILVRLPANATPEQRKAAKADIQKIRKEVMGKGADFAALARKHSQGPEAARGGELGWFPRGRMPAELEGAAFALAPGRVSEVIVSRLGFEIVKTWEKRAERQRPLEEVEQNVRSSLEARRRNERRRDVMRGLKDKAKVEKLISFAKAPVHALPAKPEEPSTQTSQR